jgi:hypothetical protein
VGDWHFKSRRFTYLKKILVYILTIAIACSFVFTFGAASALAASSVSFSVQVSPEMVSASGQNVLLEAFVNVQGDPVSNVQITYPDLVTVVKLNDGNPLTSGSHTNQDFYIPANSIDKDLAFTLTYTNVDGTQGTATDSIHVYPKASTIKVTGSASVDNKNLKQGDKATFKFTFKNEGDVKIENANLKAPPIDGGDQIGQSFSLNPGDSKEMTYTVTVNKTMEVKPTLTFTADGSNKTLTLDTLNVTVEAPAKSGLALSLSADKDTVNAGESVVLTAKVTNSGDDQITGLSLLDNNGQPVELKDSSLDKGESTEATVTVTPQSTGNYKYTATGKNSAGDAVSADSNQVTITVGSASASASTSPSASEEPSTLKIQVNADTLSLDAPGEVTFQVTVTNNSDILLNDVKVTEKTIGDIGTISAMGRDSKTLPAKAEVKETTEYSFSVTATTPDGQQVIAQTEPLTIEVKGGAGLGLGFWGVLLLIIIIAIAAIGVVLFLLYRKNKKTGGSGMFNGGGAPQAPRQNPYGARRKPSVFNSTISKHDDVPKDVQPPKAARKPISSAPHPPAKKGNTKFGDRNKF